MTYGRRFTRASVVRRGPRPRLRTRRVGYPTGKAYLRRRQGVKRRMPMLLASRPLKRRKVIQTRPVVGPRVKSPFKCQREITSTTFSTPAGGINPNSLPVVNNSVFTQLLSPRADVGIDSYRAVNGSKGRYLSANVLGSISYDPAYGGQPSGMTFVIRVVQCKVPDSIGGTAINFANDPNYASEFWKNQEYNDTEYSYSAIDQATWLTRQHMAMNMAKFKILRQKYVHVNNVNPEHRTKGFHFYIKMKAQLEEGRSMSAEQFASNRGTANTMSTVARYSYYNPIFLWIEPVLGQVDQVSVGSDSFAGLDVAVKHTFADSS